LVFYINALGAGSRWKDLFADWPDRPLLTTHSYIGAFAGSVCRLGSFLRTIGRACVSLRNAHSLRLLAALSSRRT